MSLKKALREKRNDFYANCVVETYYRSKYSSYHKVHYEQETINFCISDHHGAYRGTLMTIISKKSDKQKVKQIAWDIYKSQGRFANNHRL